MPFGEQAGPVRSDEPGPDIRKTLSFSWVIFCTARAIDEVGTSTMVSTFSVSYQLRAMLEPTSGLFWWSAAITSIGLPLTLPPKSAAAISAAITEPLPVASE
jgi:hypothetical protein